MVFLFLVSATLLEDRPLQAVYIYFDKATFGEIEREEKKTSCLLSTSSDANDLKVTMEAQLVLIGGTMPHWLTGFSILSGVEIIYYLFRFSLFAS